MPVLLQKTLYSHCGDCLLGTFLNLAVHLTVGKILKSYF